MRDVIANSGTGLRTSLIPESQALDPSVRPEISPDDDSAGITAMLAAQLPMNLLGFVFHERAARD